MFVLSFLEAEILHLAPASDVLRSEKKTLFASLDHNPFTGEPRPELDEAWHDLVESTYNDTLSSIGMS